MILLKIGITAAVEIPMASMAPLTKTNAIRHVVEINKKLVEARVKIQFTKPATGTVIKRIFYQHWKFLFADRSNSASSFGLSLF